MQDNPNTTSNGEGAAPEIEPMFTQDELNRIVGDRLHKERAKIAGELSSREEALAAREYQYAARETLARRGYAGKDGSLEILSVINAKSVDELDAALDIIERHFAIGKDNFDEAVRDALNKKLMQKGPDTHYAQPGVDVRKAMGLET